MGSDEASPEFRAPQLQVERFESTLRDGTPVLIRPLEASDRDLIRRGFERLSEESRYRRFMAPVSELTDDQLDFLTEIDRVHHFAWGAVRADRPDEGIGVARYVRVSGEPDVAEAAITVMDDYQGKGLGSLLLGLLAAAARSAGITRFRGYVLEENNPVKELLDELGVESRYDSPGVLCLEVPLDPASTPDSPAGRILKAAARRALPFVPQQSTGGRRQPDEAPNPEAQADAPRS